MFVCTYVAIIIITCFFPSYICINTILIIYIYHHSNCRINAGMLECLECWNAGMPECWNAEIKMMK